MTAVELVGYTIRKRATEAPALAGEGELGPLTAPPDPAR